MSTWPPSAARCATPWACSRSPPTANLRSPGAGAEDWLSHVMANHVPAAGRIALTPMLNERGKLIGDFTLVPTSSRTTFFSSAPMPPRMYYLRWFERHAAPSGVRVRPCAMEYVGLSVAGPALARAAAGAWCARILSNDAFPFLTFRHMDVGMVPAIVGAFPLPAISATRSGLRANTSARSTTC